MKVRKGISVLTLVLLVAIATSLATPILAADSWWNSSWAYRKSLTFDNTASTENLLNFPVLVHLDDTNIDWTKVQDAGQDIRFADSNDVTELDYEIEEWDDTVSADIWVEVPQIDLDSTEDFIYMYYGNDGASDGQDVEGTWNSNYVMVQHMDDDPDNSHIRDSTEYSNDGTKTGANEPNEVDSGVGKGQDGDGIDDKVVVSHSDSLDLTGNLTIEVQVTVDAEEAGGVVDKGYVSGGYMVWYQSEVSGFTLYIISAQANTGAVSLDTLYYVAGVVNGVANQIYLDGVPKNSLDSLVPGGNLVDVFIGSDAYARMPQCTISEVRLSSTDLSGEWIEAQHLSMTDAYITFGSEESVPADPPTDFTLAAVNDNQVDITWTNDEGAVNTEIRRAIGDYPATRTDGVQVYYGSAESYSDTAGEIGLELDKSVYYYRAWSENALGEWSDDYAEGGIGGSGMVVIAIAMVVLGLTTLSFVRKEGMLSAASIIAWLLFTFVMFNQSWPAENEYLGTATALFGITMVIIMTVVTLNHYLGLRTSPPTHSEIQLAHRKKVLSITHRKKKQWWED